MGLQCILRRYKQFLPCLSAIFSELTCFVRRAIIVAESKNNSSEGATGVQRLNSEEASSGTGRPPGHLDLFAELAGAGVPVFFVRKI